MLLTYSSGNNLYNQLYHPSNRRQARRQIRLYHDLQCIGKLCLSGYLAWLVSMNPRLAIIQSLFLTTVERIRAAKGTTSAAISIGITNASFPSPNETRAVCTDKSRPVPN